MKGEKRCVILGQYVVDHDSTIRDCAKQFGISKSTVHLDLADRLKSRNPGLYEQVRAILDKNLAERHIRGGIATKEKYLQLTKQKEESMEL